MTTENPDERDLGAPDRPLSDDLAVLEELLEAELTALVSRSSGEANDTLCVEGADWMRARSELRRAIRDLPRSLRRDLRRAHDVSLALRLADRVRQAIVGHAHRRDDGRRDRRTRYTTTVRLGPGRDRVELTGHGRRVVYAAIDSSVSWRRCLGHAVDRALSAAHLVATSDIAHDGIVERRCQRPKATRSAGRVEATSYQLTRLDDPPAGWVLDVVERESTDSEHAEMGALERTNVLLLGCSSGLRTQLERDLPYVAFDDEPRDGRRYVHVICNVLPPTSQAAANHHVAYGDEEIPAARLGVRRWRERVRALLEVLPTLLREGGEAHVLLPLGIRDARGYVEDLSLADVLDDGVTGLVFGERVEVFEVEPSAWPYVARRRSRRVAALVTAPRIEGTLVAARPLSLAAAVSSAHLPPIVAPVAPAPARRGASAYERLLADETIARACSLASVSRADARTRDAHGERIADRIHKSADLRSHEGVLRDILRLEPDDLAARVAQEPLRLVRIPKASGGEREIVVPTLVRRLLGQAIRHTIEAHVRTSLPECVRAYRPRAVDAVPMAILDVGKAVRAGHRYWAKLDFESFFDNIPHRLVREALVHYGFDARFVEVVIAVLHGARVVERVRGRVHELRKPHRVGISQGLPEAPAIANIVGFYLDETLGANRRIAYLRWSDDIVITAGQRHEVVGAVRLVRRWCARWGIGIKGVSALASDAVLVRDVRRARITFLGAEVDCNGRIRMPPQKLEAQAEKLRASIDSLAVGQVCSVSSYAGGGTDACDLDDIYASIDAYACYWRALDPRDAHEADQALKMFVAESPALCGGTTASVTWMAVLPAVHDEGPEITRAPHACSQQEPPDPGHRGPGPGAPSAPTGMGMRKRRDREGGPGSDSVEMESIHLPGGKPGSRTSTGRREEQQGCSPSTPQRAGSMGRGFALSTRVDLVTDSRAGFDLDLSDQIDDRPEQRSMSPGSSAVEEVRLILVSNHDVRRGAVLVDVQREGHAVERHVGLGGRDAGVLDVVGRVAAAARRRGAERLLVHLSHAAIPKLLVQRHRRIRSPLLYRAVLRLIEGASRLGVEIVISGTSAAAPPSPAERLAAHARKRSPEPSGSTHTHEF